MKAPTCYIVAAGEHYAAPARPDSDDMVIAADGGYDYLLHCGIRPDLLMGDLDSIDSMPTDVPVIRLPKVKDDTDTEAAIEHGRRRGFRRFVIYGGTGGRIDHTIANMQCIAEIAMSGGRGFLIGKDSVITAICNDTVRFSPKSSGFISVFAHGGQAAGVTEKGLKYHLTDAVLHSTVPLGVSNEFTGVESLVSVENGILIITYPLDTEEIYDYKEKDK